MGNEDFYGPGKTVDTDQVFTVVTQFPEEGGSLSEIRQFFIQNGQVIDMPNSNIDGVSGNSINSDFCAAQKTAFGDTNRFADMGGMSTMSTAVSQPMVLVMSLWDDVRPSTYQKLAKYVLTCAFTPSTTQTCCGLTPITLLMPTQASRVFPVEPAIHQAAFPRMSRARTRKSDALLHVMLVRSAG